MIHTIEQTQILPITMEEAWSFFSRPENLADITPSDVGFNIIHNHGDGTYPGKMISYRIKVFPLVSLTWLTEITSVTEGTRFVDDQRIGPYKVWHHQHEFKEHPDGVEMTDLVHYALPFGWLGDIAHSLFVKKKLEHIFSYRKAVIAKKFSRSEPLRETGLRNLVLEGTQQAS